MTITYYIYIYILVGGRVLGCYIIQLWKHMSFS